MTEIRSGLKNTIKKLLEWRSEIFIAAEKLDTFMKTIYQNFRPQTTAKLVQHYYLNRHDYNIYKVWDIKKRNIVHDQSEADEVYALTDSETED